MPEMWVFLRQRCGHAGRLGLRLVLAAATVLLLSACHTSVTPAPDDAREPAETLNAEATPAAYVLPAWAYDGPAAPPAVRLSDTGPTAVPLSSELDDGEAGPPITALPEVDNTPPQAPTPTPEATVLAQSVPAQPSKEFEELPGQLTEAQLEALLAEAGFPRETWAKAKAVAWCESKWSPGATGAQGERGLWQIHPRWHPDSTYDPLGNARAAYRISGGGYDWSAWSCG